MESNYLSLQLFVLTFLFFSDVKCQSCQDNRKIFLEKTGIIHDGLLEYEDNERCEWLIKGASGETVTVYIEQMNMECGYDYLFIHDGESRSSKLLARLNGQHTNITITSTNNAMYVIHYTDAHVRKDGFSLHYEISRCPGNCSNQGHCGVDGICSCYGKYNGKSCQHTWCPEECNQGHTSSSCDVPNKNCSCEAGLYGEACSISTKPNTDFNIWHSVSSWSTIFKPRAGHVAGYILSHDILLVHGGYSLNDVYDDLIMYKFSSNKWSDVIPSGDKPNARSSHASVVYNSSFIIYGGELANQLLSNELWLFDSIINPKWTLLSNDSDVPGLAGHTATLVGSIIYIFGGRMVGNFISSQMLTFNLTSEQWLPISPAAYGKESDLRLYGHTSCYYEELHAIFVFGGFHVVRMRKIAEPTNQMLMYHVTTRTWTKLKNIEFSPNHFYPPPTALHTAVITGDYMVVHGGWVEQNGMCNRSDLYFYHLKCHVWVSRKSLTSSNQENAQLRYSHKVLQKDDQTLIYVGGYNKITVLNDLMAYKVPKTVVYINESTSLIVHGSHCSQYDTEANCLDDPACSYCDDDIRHCYAKQFSHLCQVFSQVKSLKCVGICEHLTICESCTLQLNCKWCSLNMQCFDDHVKLSKCSDVVKGWWGSQSMDFRTSILECQLNDTAPGLTYITYLSPENVNYPDDVKLSFNTSVIVTKLATTKIQQKQKIMLHGFIYPYFRFDNAYHTNYLMSLKGVNINVSLSISTQNWVRQQEKVAELPFQHEFGTIPVLRNGGRLFPVIAGDEKKKLLWYFISMYSDVTVYRTPQFELRWNQSDTDVSLQEYFITKSYLQPFFGGTCIEYPSCTACITDSSCGWCPLTDKCMLRTKWNYCKTGYSVAYLRRTYAECATCQDYFHCASCTQDNFCAWNGSEQKCGRKELNVGTASDESCLLPCERLKHESQCIGSGKTACMWCTEKQSCLPFSQFTLQNQFGQCHGFHEKKIHIPQDCTQFKVCSACLEHYKCGWCYDEMDPRNGSCFNGDFSGPVKNCSTVFYYANLQYNISKPLWTYEKCPDVDECALGLAKCAKHSSCLNIYGDYECPCDQGYDGDGKTSCNKTCWPQCDHDHGTCNLTTYECECNLGWKGENCSTDCGCNGHSTCVNQTGICDQCQDYTHGEHCEFCMVESYGNATSHIGCKKCECHGHGDPSLNYCNQTDGTCFCMNNTYGKHCSLCLPGFIGNSLLGVCYRPCKRSTILNKQNETSGYLSPYNDGIVDFATCLWIISAINANIYDIIYKSHVATKNILLTITHMNASCYDSILNIYDGVPPNPRVLDAVSNSEFKNIGKVCGFDDNEKSFRSESGILSLWYEGQSSRRIVDGNSLPNGFLAKYTVLACPDNCPSPFVCKSTVKGNLCTCADGWYGAHCEEKKCPLNCNVNKAQGSCDQNTFKCVCNSDFIGDDCGESSNDQETMQEIYGTLSGMKNVDIERFGATIFHYKGNIYVFGGVGSSEANDVLQFDVIAKKWSKFMITSSKQPSQRYLHCSFLYKDDFYIFGGITNDGVSKEFWKLNMITQSWTYINDTMKHLTTIAGHSCTLVHDTVFIIGGYHPKDGLHEYLTKINLTTLIDEELKFNYLQPTGLFSHVAMYDKISGKIYTHGGVIFYDEHVQPSHRTYVFDTNKVIWNLIDHVSGEEVPVLVGHTAQVINDTAYVFGGYGTNFNEDVYAWKMSCNHWTKIKRQDWKGDGKSNFMFSSSSLGLNNTVILYGGFNDHISSSIVVVTPQEDVCNRHLTNFSCLSESICSWCEDNNNNRSSCFQFSAPSFCYLPASVIQHGTQCSYSAQQQRGCNTFSSCLSCVANHPSVRQTCKWCPSTTTCIPINERNCKYIQTNVKECYAFNCETVSRQNCKQGSCLWTSYFRKSSETAVILEKTSTYNCFPAGLLDKVSLKSQNDIKVDSQQSQHLCSSLTSCSLCLKAEGDFGGTKSCLWSEKLSTCLSYVSLPVLCTFGRCGELFTPNKISKCPKSCSLYDRCSTCLSEAHCGWCAEDEHGKGKCMPGGYHDPLSGKCGVATNSEPPVLISNSSLIWAYALCPLENECLNGHHDCGVHEECKDLPTGYSCTCKPGYEFLVIDGKRNCLPVCHEGCVHGDCVSPNQCNCSFGWTGNNCSIPCRCNGHSACASDPNICLKCHNNTQGKSCDECEVFFVGDPTNDGAGCQPCSKICYEHSDVCMTRSENTSILPHIKDNVTELMRHLKRGPKYSADVVCWRCHDRSEGEKCESCVDGYFRKFINKCIECMCNGHAFTCNKTTGTGCNCTQNTISNAACFIACDTQQCTKCASGYFGEPLNDYQCYRKVNKVTTERMMLQQDQTAFFRVSPEFLNVDIRLIVDVTDGVLDVYLADTDKIFKVDVDKRNLTHTIRFEPQTARKRRSTASTIRRIQASDNLVITYTEYGGGVLLVKSVKKRLVITVRHTAHNFRDMHFYLAMSSINRTSPSELLLYYRQDLPKIHLLLFFLVLTVILLLILSGFILGWKIRADYTRDRQQEQEVQEMVAMAKRPLGTYKLRCEVNENLESIIKRKRKNRYKTPHVMALAIQNTEDNLAAITTVMIQFPGNELSPWNIHLASGLCHAQNQQLLHVRTTNNGVQGRPVNTRILNTVA